MDLAVAALAHSSEHGAKPISGNGDARASSEVRLTCDDGDCVVGVIKEWRASFARYRPMHTKLGVEPAWGDSGLFGKLRAGR